jgi:hypothetical protein
MAQKLVLYSSEFSTPKTVSRFKQALYDTVALTNDPQTFWDAAATLDQSGYLVLLSHGDKKGPLLIDGQSGPDMVGGEDDAPFNALTALLVQRSLSFYCLSCYTGAGEFAEGLTTANCRFIAPKGTARISTTEGFYVSSIRNDKANPTKTDMWTANPEDMYPTGRGARPLVLP